MEDKYRSNYNRNVSRYSTNNTLSKFNSLYDQSNNPNRDNNENYQNYAPSLLDLMNRMNYMTNLINQMKNHSQMQDIKINNILKRK